MSCSAHPSAHADGCESCRANMWMNAAQALGAEQWRACLIIEAADKLAEAATDAVDAYDNKCTTGLELALEAFKVVRQGQ